MAQVPKAAPTELDYSRVTPAAITSSSSESHFIPNNGAIFSHTNSQIVNIPINTSGYLDTSNSYLMATFTNTATGSCALDIGPSWISRLRILSAGVVLEDIMHYNRLCAFLQLSQSDDSRSSGSIFMNQVSTLQSTLLPNYGPQIADGITDQAASTDPTGKLPMYVGAMTRQFDQY